MAFSLNSKIITKISSANVNETIDNEIKMALRCTIRIAALILFCDGRADIVTLALVLGLCHFISALVGHEV